VGEPSGGQDHALAIVGGIAEAAGDAAAVFSAPAMAELGDLSKFHAAWTTPTRPASSGGQGSLAAQGVQAAGGRGV